MIQNSAENNIQTERKKKIGQAFSTFQVERMSNSLFPCVTAFLLILQDFDDTLVLVTTIAMPGKGIAGLLIPVFGGPNP